MDLRSLLKDLGIQYWESGQSGLVSGGWLGIKCPRCDRGKGNPGLGVNLRTLKTSCWVCGGMSLASALAEASDRPVGVVRALLDGLPSAARTDPLPVGKLERPAGLGPLLPAHKRYLAGRGFDADELVARWNLQALGPNLGALSWRIYIPIQNAAGIQVSWTTRAIGDVPHGQRYRGAARTQSAVPRGDCLFGIEHVRHACVVTEGQFDVLWGGYGFVATAGVGFSPAQILALADIPVRAILFDNAPAARRRAHQLATRLAPFSGETYVVSTSGPDPASSPRAEAAELRNRFLE